MSIEELEVTSAESLQPVRLRVEGNLADARRKFRDQLRKVLDPRRQAGESPEAAAARSFLIRYLRENVEAAETIASMKDLIQEFEALAPVILVHKCIDGRVHGSKGIGYPPTTVDFLRTEGCKLDTDSTNQIFWEKMDIAVMEAAHNTPGTPALFIELAHTATEGHGCAAQSMPCMSPQAVVENSLQTVKEHADKVRDHYGNSVFALHGITNTDDMSETLIFENGTELSTSQFIEAAGLNDPDEVFTPDFLSAEITDPSIIKHVGRTTFGDLLSGDLPKIYNDLRSGIAMEVYLMKMISSGNNSIVNPKIMGLIEDVFTSAKNIPDSLRRPLIYQTIWNIAYTLYQRNRLRLMEGANKFRDKHLEHAEELIGYGEGYELLRRNKAALAKTGRGDDKKALTVAKKVLDGNRKKSADAEHPQPHRPIVHINIEVSGDITSWHQFNKQVLVKLKVMSERVREVYGDESVCIMTTYSHASGKQFYPVQVYPRPLRTEQNSSSFGVNVAAGLKDFPEFATELNNREITFTEYFAQ